MVVGTPSRVLAHINAQNLALDSTLEMLVIDEADLVLSFGFEADLKNLLWYELVNVLFTRKLHVLYPGL